MRARRHPFGVNDCDNGLARAGCPKGKPTFTCPVLLERVVGHSLKLPHARQHLGAEQLDGMQGPFAELRADDEYARPTARKFSSLAGVPAKIHPPSSVECQIR